MSHALAPRLGDLLIHRFGSWGSLIENILGLLLLSLGCVCTIAVNCVFYVVNWQLRELPPRY